jgi:hypothetical protein
MAFPFSEYFSLGKSGWTIGAAIWRWIRRNKRKLTPQDNLELRAKWKPQFTEYLANNHVKKLRNDVILRDMRRMDSYPDVTEGRGISAWFRVGLVDTYERGIMVGLCWEELVEEAEGLRYANWKANEKGEQKVLLTGFIPYENIESVDWTGDDYYSYPHIYCYFDYKGEPYERVMFCRRGENNGWPYYVEIVDAKSVVKLSKKYEISR